ncbi:MAG: hypothetical protein M8364_13000 [Methylobacter sp.]|uniref:hypothetical protein n=1 Tax=Methylobacter sp. TaxID=2051955 RepID=UPI00258B860B|nr:hypothetical protein [Methylobacter sp.]MCL7421813.1 hypothetical protein [Methylobacter sp.]
MPVNQDALARIPHVRSNSSRWIFIESRRREMSEILLCNQPLDANHIRNSCGIPIDTLTGQGCSNLGTLQAYTPYLMGESTLAGQSLLSQLAPRPVAKELTDLSLSFGEDNVLALSEITKKLQEYNIGLMGAATSVYADRIGGFAGAVKNYQDALMEYRAAVQSNSATKALARQKAHAAFERLQIQFRHELNAVTAKIKSNRGTPLTSSQRAVNIAGSSRNVARLKVTSQVQASDLVRFSKHASFLGNGLAVIDFTSRVGNIHNSYQAGEKWERELFIESSSFALSAGTGIAVTKIGLALLLAATPAGWVGLIVGGAVVAGVAAGASMGMNYYVKNNSGETYDSIMALLGIR